MAEMRLLTELIDEPGLHTISVYESLGGYAALRKALLRDGARRGPRTSSRRRALRGRGGAGFSMGKKASFIPKGAMDKYLCCNADESEPGHVQGPAADAAQPPPADRGLHHRRDRAPGPTRRSSTSAASTSSRPTSSSRGGRGLRARATSASDILGSRHSTSTSSCTAAPAPTSAARRPALLDSLEGKRGNPRLKPPFPANQGLYQGPTLINNVETLCNVPLDHRAGRRVVQGSSAPRSRPARRSSRCRATSSGPGNYEVELGIAERDIVYGLAGGPPEGRRVKCWFPGGSSAPVLTARRTSTCPTTSRRWPRPGRCSAPARSSWSTTRSPIVPLALRLARVLPPRVVRQVHRRAARAPTGR